MFDVEPIQQTELDCIPTCAYMLLRFLEKNPPEYEKLSKDIFSLPYGDGKGALVFDAAQVIKDYLPKGRVMVQFFDFAYFDKSFNDMSIEQKIVYLDNISKEYDKADLTIRRNLIMAHYIFSLKECLKKGVDLSFSIISSNQIETALKRSPVIVSLNALVLREKKAKDPNKPYKHAILLTGFDKDYFYYNDPTNLSKENFGKKKILKDKLLVSLVNQNSFPAILWFES